MGTNYFHRTEVCGTCGRYDHAHIGKNLTMFEGRFTWDDDSNTVPEIVSWRQWRDRIRAGGEVWNEYGVRLGTEEFIARVESTDAEHRRRQFDWEAEHDPARAGTVGRQRAWLDEDGFSFYGGEFS